MIYYRSVFIIHISQIIVINIKDIERKGDTNMISAKGFIRNVNFTTDSADYELLQDTNIKQAIMERLGLEKEEDYQRYLDNKQLNMYFEIYFTSPQKVSVNKSYYYSTMEGDLYYSGDFVNPVQSIKIQANGASGMIAFQIA